MNAVTRHAPALAHRVAVAVLLVMEGELKRRGRSGRPQFDHAAIFEKVLLLAGDELRRSDPPVDLGLQTEFRAPRAGGDTRPVVLRTITTVLAQCVEEGWLEPPKPGRRLNYSLTAEGRELANALLEGKAGEEQGLDELHRRALRRVVARWLGEPKPSVALRHEMRRLAGRAWAEPVAVPHYDLGDPRLQPYLEGVARRVRRRAERETA